MRAPEFGKILLAVDRSPQSENAVSVLIRFAPPGSRILVVHVWNPEVIDHRGWWDVETRTEAQALVDQHVAALQAAGHDAAGELRSSPTSHLARAICRAATEFDADLIAMGSRGRSDLGGLFLGSVSHQVVAGTDRPVLIVRAAPDKRKAGRRILLALADGEEAPSAVGTAISVARRWEAEVVVLHVSTIVAADGIAWVEPPEEAESVVDRAVRELKDAGVPARGQVVTATGPIASDIAEAALGWDVDLIVMGSRRLGELRGLLTGATDHRLVHQIETPVLITEHTTRT
jgi:nucleotide-binding universal stress UspA family protein